MRRIDVVFHATIVGDVDPSSITSRTPELGAVGWFSPDDLLETDREAGDVTSLIKQVEPAAASCSFADGGRRRRLPYCDCSVRFGAARACSSTDR